MSSKRERVVAEAKRRRAEAAEKADARERDERSRSLSSTRMGHNDAIRLPPWETHGHLNFYFLAAVCMGFSVLAYYNNTTLDNDRRLAEPVAVAAAVSSVECRLVVDRYKLYANYAFQGVKADGTTAPQFFEDFIGYHQTPAECEAGGRAVDRTPFTVWHEKGDPSNWRWTLEEENHRRFLWGFAPGLLLVALGLRAERRIRRAKMARAAQDQTPA